MSQKRKRKELKRGRKKTKPTYKPINKIVTILTNEMEINEYIKQPSFDKLNQLINKLSSDSDFDNLYASTIDDKRIFPQLTELEVAVILYVSERIIESITIFKHLWDKNKCLISLNYLFLAAVDRNDLNLASKMLIEIEQKTDSFEQSMIGVYRMMYGLISGHHDYTKRVAQHYLLEGVKDIRVFKLILQVASRLENGHLVANVLCSKIGDKLLEGIGKQQLNRIKKILRRYLLEILMERANE